jgi:hypothetical protein
MSEQESVNLYAKKVDDLAGLIKTISTAAKELAKTNRVCRSCGDYAAIKAFVPKGITAGGVVMPLLKMDNRYCVVDMLQEEFLEAFNSMQPPSCTLCSK